MISIPYTYRKVAAIAMFFKFFKRTHKINRKNSKLFILSILLGSYLIICLILTASNMLIHSSLVKSTQNYIEHYYTENLNKTVTNMEHNLSAAYNFYVSISNSENLSKLISATNSQSVEQELSLKLAREIYSSLNATNFSYAYIYIDASDMVVTKNYIYSSRDFYDFFYAKTNLTYDNWMKSITSSNLGNYLSIHDSNTAYVDLLYQLPTYIDGMGALATFVVRLDNKELLHIVENNVDETQSMLNVYDANGTLLLTSSDPNDEYVLSLSDISHTATIFKTDNSITICQTSAANPWRYFYTVDSNQFFKQIKHTRIVSISCIIFSFIICCIMGLLFSLKHFKPFYNLLNAYKGNLKSHQIYNYSAVNDAVLDYIECKQNLGILQREQSKKQSSYTPYLTAMLNGLSAEKNFSVPVFPSEWFSVILFRPYNNDNLFGEEDALEKSEIENTTFIIVQNIMEELFNKNDVCHIIKFDKYIAGIYCYKNQASTEIYKANIYNAVISGLSAIESNFNFSILTGVSSVICGKSNIPLAYHQADLALFFQNNDNSVMFYDEIYKKNVDTNKFLFEFISNNINNLTVSIKSGDINASKQIFNSIFQHCAESLSIEKSRLIIISLENTIMSLINDYNGSTEKINTILRTTDFNNLSMLHQSLSDIIEEICVINNSINTEKHQSHNTLTCENTKDSIVPKIVNYLRENFDDTELNLSSLSQKFYLSPTYLSRVFKNKTGESLLDTLAKLRIEKAKSLLNNTELSIADIYNQCGFTSEKTFSRTFQKYESLSPGKYRNLHR